MLDDPRAESLATRFATQWLRVPDLEGMRPDPRYFPYIHRGIKDDMRRETELFFHSIVEDDRPVTEVMTANYTFMNQDLAEHYGIPGVTGDDFRRVQHSDEDRYGVLGQGSILTQTSFARRTSPVNRGKFVMEVLLGTAPPPPPPNVPDLEVTTSVDGESGRALTVKERMEMHRVNPTCSACHQFIDPQGLPLETFGATGKKASGAGYALATSAGSTCGSSLNGLPSMDSNRREPSSKITSCPSIVLDSQRTSPRVVTRWLQISITERIWV